MTAPSYVGHVAPDGPAIQRQIALDDTTVRLTKVSVGPMDNNCYVLEDVATSRALVIDAAAEPDRVLQAVGGATVTTVVTTHGHRDHWQALRAVHAATGAQVAHHPDDAGAIPVPVDRALLHADTVAFGRATAFVLHTPGHTPGSICLLLHGKAVDRPAAVAHLFTGDTLFPGGPGRTTTPAQFQQIMGSLRERLFTLSDETWVYPGHGDDTTLGVERPHLDDWQARGW